MTGRVVQILPQPADAPGGIDHRPREGIDEANGDAGDNEEEDD
jgi:hypothetical protein